MFQSGEQRVSNPAIITWLASTNAPRHVLTKGVKLNFQKSLMKTDELFARANSHDKVSMTNETGTPIKLAQTFVTKKKTIDKIFVSTRANELVSIGLWALQRHRQASQYTK